jgi:hypothetical protein
VRSSLQVKTPRAMSVVLEHKGYLAERLWLGRNFVSACTSHQETKTGWRSLLFIHETKLSALATYCSKPQGLQSVWHRSSHYLLINHSTHFVWYCTIVATSPFSLVACYNIRGMILVYSLTSKRNGRQCFSD